MKILITLLIFFLSITSYSQKKIDEFIVKPVAVNDAQSNAGTCFFRENYIVYTSHAETTRSLRNTDFFASLAGASGVVSEGEALDQTFNSYINEVDLVFTSDFKKVYFTRSFVTNENKILGTYDTHYDLYVADVKDDNTIYNIKSLPINYDKYSTAHPSLSADDKTLYFASDRLESLGGFDIFKVDITENGKRFGHVINLGPNVNTAADEITPFVLDDTLYFSSNGRTGFGEHDVFSINVNLEDEAKNLGKTLNSESNDFSFIRKRNQNYGFFVSNRVGGKGDNDIYFFNVIQVDAPVEVVKTPKTNEDIVSTDSTISNENSSTTNNTNIDDTTDSLTTSEIDLNKTVEKHIVQEGDVEYEEKVVYKEQKELSENTYAFQRRTTYHISRIEVSRTRHKIRDLTAVEKVCVTRIQKLNDIYFDLGKFTIRPEAQKELNKAIRIMKKCPNLRFVASSYTDSRGSAKFNRKLSQRRANAVVQYILANSNLSADVIGIGFGESGLKNNCYDGVKCTNKQHQVNRRTEIEISIKK